MCFVALWVGFGRVLGRLWGGVWAMLAQRQGGLVLHNRIPSGVDLSGERHVASLSAQCPAPHPRLRPQNPRGCLGSSPSASC